MQDEASQPTNDGVRAAIAYFTNSPSNESRALILDALRSGVLLLAVRDRPAAEVASGASKEQILTTGTPDGMQALVAFTDAESAQARVGEGVRVMAEPCAAVFRRLLDGGYNALVVNPAGPWAYVTRPEIERLLAGAE